MFPRREWRKECTPFQKKVYEAVLGIPKGQVRTYAEIARAIGQPQAARAVGQALKRNRWAPKIPCHRVVAAARGGRTTSNLQVVAGDRSLGGYSAPGGLKRKKQLLRREKGPL